MDIALAKRFIDSCHEAKRVIDMLPILPAGITPRHVRVIDNLHELADSGRRVRISDISDAMRVTRPGVTRLINELVGMDYIIKTQDSADKRVIWLTLTASGEEFYRFYCLEYHTWLSELLADIPQEDIEAAIRSIYAASSLMRTADMNDMKLKGIRKKL